MDAVLYIQAAREELSTVDSDNFYKGRSQGLPYYVTDVT